MFATMEGPELFVLLVIVLVVFGGSRLPSLARSLGEAIREFRRAADAQSDDDLPTDRCPP